MTIDLIPKIYYVEKLELNIELYTELNKHNKYEMTKVINFSKSVHIT